MKILICPAGTSFRHCQSLEMQDRRRKKSGGMGSVQSQIASLSAATCSGDSAYQAVSFAKPASWRSLRKEMMLS